MKKVYRIVLLTEFVLSVILTQISYLIPSLDWLALVSMDIIIGTLIFIFFKERRNIDFEKARKNKWLRWIFPPSKWSPFSIEDEPKLCITFAVFLTIVGLILINILYFMGKL